MTAAPIVRWPGLIAAALLAGCASLQPALPPAQPDLPAGWPLPPAATDAAASAALPVADVGWQQFFDDAGLQALIALALENNRDLRVAVLNVERARALYRIQRAGRVPPVAADAVMERTGGDPPGTDLYSVAVGVTGFELDLFGRVRDLSEAELQRFLATEAARRGTQLALIAEVATAYLAAAADADLQRLARETVDSYQATLQLTERRHALGAASALEVSQAQAAVESARADLARFTALRAQDANALRLLVGAALDPALLPGAFAPLGGPMAAVPAGLPSELLLRRPDVIAAEHRLRAANASIGAARAAFFPSITLTGSVGTASDQLAGLFESGSRTWSFAPRIRLPIFEGGRLRAALDVAEAERDISLAEYDRSIQAGFRDVADALALSRTLREQGMAQEALLAAAERARALSDARYRAGQDSYLVLLDTQRTLYAARRGLIATQLAEQANRVALYKAMGGGWTAPAAGPAS